MIYTDLVVMKLTYIALILSTAFCFNVEAKQPNIQCMVQYRIRPPTGTPTVYQENLTVTLNACRNRCTVLLHSACKNSQAPDGSLVDGTYFNGSLGRPCGSKACH
jgi:hypothetical protein